MKTILITGASSGIGLALARHCLESGDRVRALSRRRPPLDHEYLDALELDLADPQAIQRTFPGWLAAGSAPELVVLNAGVAGRLGNLAGLPLEDLRRTMMVNVWANKLLLDLLLAAARPPRQVVGISSGAAVQAHHGFAGYSISKAALNMLTGLYAAEFPRTHFSALAPGIIATPMQEMISETPDRENFATLQFLHETRMAGGMVKPEELAPRLLKAFEELLERPSGSFDDLRGME